MLARCSRQGVTNERPCCAGRLLTGSPSQVVRYLVSGGEKKTAPLPGATAAAKPDAKKMAEAAKAKKTN